MSLRRWRSRARKVCRYCRAVALPRSPARPSGGRWSWTFPSTSTGSWRGTRLRRAVWWSLASSLTSSTGNSSPRACGFRWRFQPPAGQRLGVWAGKNWWGRGSIGYGIMRDNVLAIDAILADGSEVRFGEVGHNLAPTGRGWADGEGALGAGGANANAVALIRDLLALGRREAEHIAHAFPAVSRRVGGYLIDALVPSAKPVNLATLLCGSEGTLAVSRRLELKLSPIAKNKALGVCHFASFRKAMEATPHIVALGPVAVEVVDRTLIELARDIALFRPVMEGYVRGSPD